MRADLLALIQPIVESFGLTLWGIEFKSGSHGRGLLRVYINHEDGIHVDDCEKVSKQLSRVMDVEDPIRGEYVLEVSSPGLNPTLFFKEQYLGFCGERLQVKTHLALDGRKNFKGQLIKVLEDSIEIRDDDTAFEIRFDNIAKANVIALD